MIFIRKFKEEFVDYYKNKWDDLFPVYLNPTSSEIKEIMTVSPYKEARVILLKKGSKIDCYLWSSEAPHFDMARFLKIPYPINPKAMFGVVKDLKGSHGEPLTALDFITLSELIAYPRPNSQDDKYIESVFSTNWKNKYVDVVHEFRALFQMLSPEKRKEFESKVKWFM